MEIGVRRLARTTNLDLHRILSRGGQAHDDSSQNCTKLQQLLLSENCGIEAIDLAGQATKRGRRLRALRDPT
eukprot:9292071-Pyramimonas_sp.AAC.1